MTMSGFLTAFYHGSAADGNRRGIGRMNGKIALNKTHLQLIAIVAMVIDHMAWAFLDFRTVPAQIMHIAGRLTIPIMCFFIAEGFRRTRALRSYISRVATFAIVSVIPFWVFFHEEYGYRQNILFDHLLSLLILTVLESRSLDRWQKGLLVTLLLIVSLTVGGWPVTPALFTLAFYYGRTFREKAKWFIGINLLTVLVLSILAGLNQVYSFSSLDWTWYDRFYLLGFMLALPVIACYNGEKGKMLTGRYFFYFFYPAHLLILAFLKYLAVGNVDVHDVYVWFHVLCLLLVLIMLVAIFRSGASRMQSAIVMFLVFESFYVVGFIIEQLASEVETLYMAGAIEYFGELLMLIAVVLFASECGRIRFPMFLYAAQVLAALALVYTIIRSPETGFFYSTIRTSVVNGHIKPEYVHATGYYLSVLYIIVVIAELLVIMINSLVRGSMLEKKRVGMILAASMFIWIPYAITLTGITGGYEIPGLGVVGAGVFLSLCFMKYGTLDSVAIASENALEKAGEGVIIIDDRRVVTFTNALAERILGNDSLINTHAEKNASIREILEGDTSEFHCDDRVYEVKVEELKHASLTQGYTIWFLDATEHREQLDEAESMAYHDALTGLYNRRQFEKLVEQEIAEKRPGTLVISDMDNFKAINDTYGHRRGDQVLTDYAEILQRYPEALLYPCRIGGDEFMFYLRGVTEQPLVEEVLTKIMGEFARRFRDGKVKCTLSMGAVINDSIDEQMDFASMYRAADKKLYTAKENGKNTFVL